MSELITLDSERWYSTAQVVVLGRQGYFPFKSISTIYQLINEGKIPVVRKGDDKKMVYVIQGKDLIAYAESQKSSRTKQNDKPMQKNSPKTKGEGDLSNTSRGK